MTTRRVGAFWEDLTEDLCNPEFRSEYDRQTIRIATFDRLLRELEDARTKAGISKAELARRLDVEPATVRRLLSAREANPTLGTLSELAAVLGLEVTLTPISKTTLQTNDRGLRRRYSSPSS